MSAEALAWEHSLRGYDAIHRARLELVSQAGSEHLVVGPPHDIGRGGHPELKGGFATDLDS
jgi:hypothetical protein